MLELVRRYARTHGPFTLREAADRFALDAAAVENALRQLAQRDACLKADSGPGGLHREWCDAEILRQIRRKSLAKLRREVEPVEQHTLARFLTHWQGLLAPRRTGAAHLDALLDAIENLQGAPLPASLVGIVDSARAHRRLHACRARHVDRRGRSGVGRRRADRRARRAHRAVPCRQAAAAGAETATQLSEPLTEREEKLLAVLESTGASFFDPLHQAAGGGYPGETIDALWSLVWRGLITNDSLHALRAYIAQA